MCADLPGSRGHRRVLMYSWEPAFSLHSHRPKNANWAPCPALEETVETHIGSTADALPAPIEDEFTKTLERYTAQIPSSALLAVAVGAMGLSLVSQLGGRGKWGNFIAQWVPTIIVMGVYNKLVKLEGHDRRERGQGNTSERSGSASGISNRPLAAERAQQASLPPRGQSRMGAE